MPGDYAALAAELQSPDLSGLDDSAAADKLNTDAVAALVPGRFLAEGGVLDLLGPADGATVIGTVEALAELEELPGGGTNPFKPVMQIVVRLLRKDGIDFGSANVHGMLDQLAGAGALSPGSVDALKAHGTRTTSRAESIAGWGLAAGAGDVARARSL